MVAVRGCGADIIAELPYLRKRLTLGILSDFERRLGGMIEGLFTKAFRTGVQPVELARRILKEMEANKTVGVREVWVPNNFLFTVSAIDRQRFERTEKVLRRELEQVVRDAAAERGWDLVGAAKVEFETDPDLGEGEFRCEPSLVEGPTTAGQSKITPAPAALDTPAPAAELVLLQNGRLARAFPLGADPVVIGRLGESDVVVPDPGASRRHAEVRRRDGDFVIRDLGSTNGTMVNEAKISEQALEEGDRIVIGRTVLEFRKR